MSYQIQSVLPSPDQVKGDLPRSETLRSQIYTHRQEIAQILGRHDPRLLVVIGPCSAWPSEAVDTYATRLATLQAELKPMLKLVLRVYTQKPRTTIGWTGPLNQLDPYKPADIPAGIYYCRQMMLQAAEKGLALADEALFTHNDGYFIDLLSWLAIGARSSEDQEHRIFASMISHPVGLKNPTSGNLTVAINSIIAAQHPHVFSLHGRQVSTSGNPLAHLILRGGAGKPNAQPENIEKALTLLQEKSLSNPSVMIDASHENSIDPQTGKKDPLRQPKLIAETIQAAEKSELIRAGLSGFMVESFLQSGNQSLDSAQRVEDLAAGLSVTDPCLGWNETETMLRETAQSWKALMEKK